MGIKMADEELKIESDGKKRKLKLIIILVAVLLVVAGGAVYFLLGSNDEQIEFEVNTQAGGPEAIDQEYSGPAKMGTALYVSIPNSITFNVPGASRDRLVEIKVQLMVRGTKNEEKVKMHIPSIQGALNTAFSRANADDLSTEAGKIAARDNALKEVQKILKDVTGSELVEQVLFTGFVMQ
ncbi:MAG: flagellar FliL protein [Paraglaciecola sp.]|jgi:flagellar FliL protein